MTKVSSNALYLCLCTMHLLLQDPVLLELLWPVSREIPVVIPAAEIHASWVCDGDSGGNSISFTYFPVAGVHDSLV